MFNTHCGTNAHLMSVTRPPCYKNHISVFCLQCLIVPREIKLRKLWQLVQDLIMD